VENKHSNASAGGSVGPGSLDLVCVVGES